MELSSTQRSRILITLMFGTFLSAMTVSITSVMLPVIIEHYNIATTSAQWLTSGATLVSAIVIPFAAFLIKRVQSKIYFIVAISLLITGSFIAFIAPTFSVLLIGRLVQALGAGMLVPFAQVVLMSIYPKEEHGAKMGLFSMASMVAPIVAPTIAGFLIESIGWQMVFLIIGIIGSIVLVLGISFMKNVLELFKVKLPIMASIICTIGFSALLIGLGNISSHTLFTFSSGGLLLIGIIFIALFIFNQLTTDPNHVFLNLRIFRFPRFTFSVLLGLFIYLIVMGSSILLPLYAQSIRGFGASSYAMATLPGSLLMAFFSIQAGRLYDRYGAKQILTIGVTLILAGTISGFLFSANSNLIHIGLTGGLLQSGMGFISSPITTISLGSLEGKDRVDGSAILNTCRQLSSTLASIFSVATYAMFSNRWHNPVQAVKGDYGIFIVYTVILIILTFIFITRYAKEKTGMRKRTA